MHPTETRAEIARRRLAALVEEFHAHTGASTDAPTDGPTGADTADDPDAHDGAEAAAQSPVEVDDRPRFALTQRHVRAAAVLAIAIGVVVAWWLFAARPQHESVPDAPVPVVGSGAGSDTDAGSQPGAGEPATELVIDVVGHVETPGIVVLPLGSRVADAIEAAGGITGDVDRETLNFARELTDGEQILVGIEPAVPSGHAGSAGGSNAGALINVNTADAATLEELPGVGPVTARAIVDHRAEHGRFPTIDALIDVSGIGEATLATLRPLVTV